MSLHLIIFVALFMGLLTGESAALVVCDWGGDTSKIQKEAFYEPFEKATGIKVTAVAQPSAAKVKAMYEANNMEWDVICMGGNTLALTEKMGLMEKIDYKYFDQKILDQLYQEAKHPFGVGIYYFSMVISYRTDVYPKGKHPKNWAEFWDVKKFPGPRCLHSPVGAATGWEPALLADGVPMDKLYQNPDLDRAFMKMKEIKPHVVKWWEHAQLPVQMLVDKQIVLADAYNARIELIKEQGVPVDYEWNGGRLYLLYWTTPKRSRYREDALKFIAFASRADRQAAFVQRLAYGPVNKEAFKTLSPQRAAILPSAPDNIKKQYLIDDEWYRDNTSIVIDRWNKWILEK